MICILKIFYEDKQLYMLKMTTHDGVTNLNTFSELEEFQSIADFIYKLIVNGEDEDVNFTDKILPYYHQMITIIDDTHLYADEQPSDKEIQTDSQIDIKTIKYIIYNYPELKDTAIGILLSDLVKRGNITKTDIDEIQNIYKSKI